MNPAYDLMNQPGIRTKRPDFLEIFRAIAATGLGNKGKQVRTGDKNILMICYSQHDAISK